MGRRKPKQVNVVKHANLGVEVPIMLDFDSMVFSAEYAGRRFSGKDGKMLAAEVYAAIVQAAELQWTPIIEVEDLRPFAVGSSDDMVGFALRRLYVAQAGDGSWRKVQWTTDPESRTRMCDRFYVDDFSLDDLPLQSGRRHSGDKYYLPYSDAAWTSLEVLQENIRQLAAILRTMLTTQAGLERLTSGGPLLALPEGSEGSET